MPQDNNIVVTDLIGDVNVKYTFFKQIFPFLIREYKYFVNKIK